VKQRAVRCPLPFALCHSSGCFKEATMTASHPSHPPIALALPSRRRALGLAAALLLLGPARLGWAQGNHERGGGRAPDEPNRGNNDRPNDPRRDNNDRRDEHGPMDRRDMDRRDMDRSDMHRYDNGYGRGGDRYSPQRDWHDGRDGRDGRGAGPDHSFRRGQRLPQAYRHRNYVVDDWRGHRLSAPPRGYQWVQTGSDYVLVAIATGVILQLLLRD
jgi:Ni/Co efflux regulator RcnB